MYSIASDLLTHIPSVSSLINWIYYVITVYFTVIFPYCTHLKKLLMSAFPSTSSVADTDILMYLHFSSHMQFSMGRSQLQKCVFSSLHSLSFILPAIHFNRFKNCKLCYSHNHRQHSINWTTFCFTSSVSLTLNFWQLLVTFLYPLWFVSGATKQVDFSYCLLP